MNELQERGLALLRDDLTLFASECLVVAPKAPGPNIPLKFNSAQMFVHQRLEDQIARDGWVRAMVLKGRQQGISTYTAARYYHKTSMHKGHRALIIAHEQQASDNLFEMVRRYHKANPLRPSIQASNAKELKFGALGSGYRVSTAGTKDTGRGGTFQLAHASEYGFWPNADGHSAGLAQTVADLPGTEIIKESTANGVGNAFHVEWQQAESGEGDYIPIFVPWFWQDEYRRRVPIDFELDADEERIMTAYGLSLEQMAWRQAKIKSLGADRAWIFRQEYPMTSSESFISRTEDPFIPVVLVMEAINNTYREVYGPLIVGVDPAEHGEDRTAIVFRRGRLVTRIETYKDKETMETAGIVANIINEHKPDAVMIDSIGIGAGIYSRLRELGHDNVISVRSGRRARDDKQYVNKRAEMWADLKKWLEERPCRMPNNQALASDLSAPQYGYDSSGRLQIEPKPKMKARGVRSPDCFVAGMMVDTPSGKVDIASIRAGDLVNTPTGPRKVIRVWESEASEITEVAFSNGSRLVGKGSHDVFTFDRGWTRLDALTESSEVETSNWKNRAKWKFLGALLTGARHSGFKAQVATISQGGRIRRRDFFTAGSGLTRTAQFLRGITSITRTATGLITGSAISRLWRQANITQATCESGSEIPSTGPLQSQPLARHETPQRLGTAQRKELRGTGSTASAPGKGESRRALNAPSAGRITGRFSRIAPASAQGRASAKSHSSATRRLLGSALYVVQSFISTSTGSRNVAPVTVQTSSVPSAVKVYNLTLDEENVYYVSGILVANCADALCLTFAEPVSTARHDQLIVTAQPAYAGPASHAGY